jgi:cellulose synthase/poly-beta-1,6-N-acetylglucosamine synthase-like glycosyltransferase
MRDLVRLALAKRKELPCFKVVVPAFQESAVIEATVRRLAAVNYPRTHFELYVVTYADEPAVEGMPSTHAIAERTARQINAESGRPVVRVLSVPAAYDGFFPGAHRSEPPQIGKPRGLNFALRTVHEENERDERTLYLGHMRRLGLQARATELLGVLAGIVDAAGAVDAIVERHFAPTGADFIGALSLSSQLRQALHLALRLVDRGEAHAGRVVLRHVQAEAPRFFLQLVGLDTGSSPAPQLAVMPGKEFLHDLMCTVEAGDPSDIERTCDERTLALQREQPLAWAGIAAARDGDELWQQVRAVGSRWLMVYDADADAPADLMRYLAACILSDPQVMGFQGPVAPVANLAAVHPLCKLGGLWMAFWHGTNYPRLMNRPDWAHPLAGTNWCLRIEGFERDGRLVRDHRYDESRRRFLLSFDPEQLTEDLEAGIRIFNDWKINAEWHPYLEMEQVPPTPRTLVVQRTRWTLGTLQTLGYIVRSKLPRLQRARFALHPIEILVSGSGPVVTLLLWVLVLSGELRLEPVFLAWTIVLTFGNLLYVLSFLRTFSRFDAMASRAAAVRFVREQGPRIASAGQGALREGRLGGAGAVALDEVAGRLEQGLSANGFITQYLQGRCVDDAPRGNDGSAESLWVLDLLSRTPSCLRRDELPALASEFRRLASAAQVQRFAGTASPDIGADLQALAAAIGMGSGHGSPLGSPLRNRVEIWLWTFPYLFFQLVPYFKGLAIWLSGRRATQWHKTPRTPKASQLGTAADHDSGTAPLRIGNEEGLDS